MEGKGDTTPTDAGLLPGLLGEAENARPELPAVPARREGLAAALAMIAELPLTPAEKADAVRRLLADEADQDAKGKP